MSVSLQNIRHVALDLDGTIYTGRTVFDPVEPFLELLDSTGIGYTFLTNNSSRGKQDYLDHLHALGIKATKDRIYSSGDATIEYLREQWPDVRRLFLLGTKSLADQFSDAGFVLCDDSPDEVPDLVVVGFDTELVYSRLCRTAYWIVEGIPYVATHPDRVCPTNQRTVLPDCGAICAALENATGRKPYATVGKPNARMLEGILSRFELEPAELAMVGDRIYTDIRMANEVGALGVLVLTGETNREDLAKCDMSPALVVNDLGEFAELFRTEREIDVRQK